jgi:KDO2-lipid IV(A) lauroyltransferase
MKARTLDEMVEIDKESLDNFNRIKERSNNKKGDKGGIIFSGHLGNWEVGLRYMMVNGVKANALYRPLNNRYVNNVMGGAREFDPIPKGKDGLREIIAHIKRGEYVIILADQRVADGEKIKFFHKEALTTTSIARIALKYGAEIIPARSYRTEGGSNFKIEINRPLEIKQTEDVGKDVTNITTKINEILEKWIRQTPSQWFWVHNRWK